MKLKRAGLVGLILLSSVLASCGGGGGDGGNGGAGANPSGQTQFYPGTTSIPVFGPDVIGAAAIDQAMMGLMRQYNIAGAAVAVAKDGRLILARGYGYADFEAKQPTQPDSMFRIASLSKLLTSMSILRLHDQGQLDLDEKFVNILSEYPLQANADARLRDITIRNLLQHSGGWDRTLVSEPYDKLATIASAQRVSLPVPSADVMRYMLGQPLQFTPGTRFAYMNFGYGVLGRIITKVSGQSYENYVRDQILTPIGVHAMSIGQPRLTQRGPYEVKYYSSTAAVRNSELGEGSVPSPYSLDTFLREASGGWIASAVDLTRVMTALDGSRVPSPLSVDSMSQLLADPHLPGTVSFYANSAWYGLGTAVGPTSATYGLTGLNPGTSTGMAHLDTGYTFAILTNTDMPNLALMNTMMQTLAAGLAGSPTDLYALFPSPDLQPSRP